MRLGLLPLVRQLYIDVEQKLFDSTLDEDVRHRMSIKPGAYLPYFADNRECVLDDESVRINEYLFDEGYFEAEVKFKYTVHDDGGTELRVVVTPGPEYLPDFSHPEQIVIADQATLAVLSAEDIRDRFTHATFACIRGECLYGTKRFRRDKHLSDIADVLKDFHTRGYPAARVATDYDPNQPALSIDRTTKKVIFHITADAGRKLDVDFEGPDKDAIPPDQLRAQLTFDSSGSSDDVEAQLSANAIAAFLQTRGFFDARVTWTRRREPAFDRITFHVELGPPREVAGVSFTHDDPTFTLDDLTKRVSTKAVRLQDAVFGTGVPGDVGGARGRRGQPPRRLPPRRLHRRARARDGGDGERRRPCSRARRSTPRWSPRTTATRSTSTSTSPPACRPRWRGSSSRSSRTRTTPGATRCAPSCSARLATRSRPPRSRRATTRSPAAS